ncbi:phosphatidylinositol-4-phosphate 5-kinase-like protein [Perkinsela sp. CCAP 1560/4]|nr:phosphatidylinositol-4-phosphate 5-kinase-like protein [Perkinsela sp. CCAP 1560/4]|eukprot:KNH08737.1 phosphatidylinositol-4-phosphate 5-kinase-like protein [Perkinsela sp. CCAP 1560/4]
MDNQSKRWPSREKNEKEAGSDEFNSDSLLHFRERYFGDSYILCKSKQDDRSIVFRSINDESTRSFTVWKHTRCHRHPNRYHYLENIGTPVRKDHPSYYILQCMKIGMIRSLSDFDRVAADFPETKYTIDTIMPVDEKAADDLVKPDYGPLKTVLRCCASYVNLFQRNISTKVIACHPDASDLTGSSSEGAHIRLRFQFISHFGKTYSKIRSLLSYAMKPLIEELASDDWSSTPTPGKSTALLFFCGPKWVVKTVTPSEKKFLSNTLLSEYHSYFAENPETLLPHFLGCYTLVIKSGFGGPSQELSFVLMKNMVPIPMGVNCEQYDLKGSLVDRSTTRNKPNQVLKDLDLRFKIHIVNEAVRKKLLNQCRADVSFLVRMGVMDYSLLLGVVRGEDHADCEVVIGLVDILQTYNLRKRFERLLKGIIFDRRFISCAPPKEYGQRFLKFVESLFV